MAAAGGSTYQGLHGAVQGVTVVAAELGVDTLQGGVTVSLGLLDTGGGDIYQRAVQESVVSGAQREVEV